MEGLNVKNKNIKGGGSPLEWIAFYSSSFTTFLWKIEWSLNLKPILKFLLAK